jgi:hypothetical protein
MILRSNRTTLRSKTAVAALLALAAAVVPSGASAVGTRTFDLEKLADLEGGDLTGVSADSRGNLRAGFNVGKLPIAGADTAWSALPMPDGSVLIGTGNEGKVARVTGGQASFVATTGQMAVSALALAWNGDAVAGTFPSGKLYRLGKAFGAAATEAKAWSELAGAEYVWGLTFDPKARALYAATGPEGKVFRIDEGGRAQVHFDAEDSHVVSIALAPDGTLYAGTAGKALLLKITAAGRAEVVHDFEGDDVSAIAVAKDGTVWATANKYTGGFSPPPKREGLSQPGPSSSKPGNKSGEGSLWRFAKGRSPEAMFESKKAHLTSLSLADDGRPYVGTGSEGRVYTVDDDHLEALVADVESRQVSAIVAAGGKRFLVGSDPATFHEVRGMGGADATWTSKPLDAGMRATWGTLGWTARGTVELQTRSGNTAEPDVTWSAWSNALAAPGKVSSPPGRYIQLRGRWARDPNAVISDLKLHFVTDNARAVVTAVDAKSKAGGEGEGLKTGLLASGGKAATPSSKVNLKWTVENPDKDELRYRITYKKDGQTQWRDALKPGDVYTKTDLDWDTTALPEGTYRVRVEATDEIANPPERVMRHALESGPVLVDNTPPVFRSLTLQGRRLNGEVADGLGPIARIEIAVAGTDDWRPLFPTDGVFDDPSERIDVDVSSIIPAGNWLIAVRVYDTAGNAVSRELEAR